MIITKSLYKKKITKLISEVKIKISICFYPGGNNKNIGDKIIREAAKKCVGADCNKADTTTIITQQGNKPTSTSTNKTNVSSHSTNDKQQTGSKVIEKNNNNDQEKVQKQREKAIKEPIKSTQDKVKESIEKPTIESFIKRLENGDKNISATSAIPTENLPKTKDSLSKIASSGFHNDTEPSSTEPFVDPVIGIPILPISLNNTVVKQPVAGTMNTTSSVNQAEVSAPLDQPISTNNVPTPPPFKGKTPVVSVAGPQDKFLQQGLEDAVKDREEEAINKKIHEQNMSPVFDELHKHKERHAEQNPDSSSDENLKPSQVVKVDIQKLLDIGVLKYQGDEEKLTDKFYTLKKLIPKNENDSEISSDTININKIVFHVGILEVTAIEETEFLKGTQTHVVVWFYTENNSKIVCGYLTSDKSAPIKLSEQQPFNFDVKKSKDQLFLPLPKPIIIVEEKHLKPLSETQLNDGSIVEQQKIGDVFVNSEKVHPVIKKTVENLLKNNNVVVENYDGKGITLNDTINVVEEEALQRPKRIDQEMKSYIKTRNLQNNGKLENWWINKKNTLDKTTFEELQNKITEYENKFK